MEEKCNECVKDWITGYTFSFKPPSKVATDIVIQTFLMGLVKRSFL